MKRLCIGLLPWLALACGTSGLERNELDETVGDAEAPPIVISSANGSAQVRELSRVGVTVWSSTPEVSIEVTNAGDEDLDAFNVVFANALQSTELVARDGDILIGASIEVERSSPTERQLRLAIRAGQTVSVSLEAPPRQGPFRFVVMGDIQTALSNVDEVFDAINGLDELEFVLCTGDIVEAAKDEESELFDRQLETLSIPFYSTIGNHEIKRDPENWHRRYGRFSIYFVYRGVAFSFVDSANASVHPGATDRLLEFLDANRDRLHVVGTHYPPFDPIGGRSASFRSRNEASAFLARLADGNVDLTFYGHIHSYYAYTNAGIPAFISGGGGAYPEQWDGVGRHFLVVTVDAETEKSEVGLVRVD